MKKLTHVEVEWIDAQSSLDVMPINKAKDYEIAVKKINNEFPVEFTDRNQKKVK